MTPEGEALLMAAGQQLGLALESHLPVFAALQSALLEGNAQMNLTALTAERDIILKHFIDSLTCLRGGWLEGAELVVDLGTGAGFPALPIAIVRPETTFLAVDATRKKVDYVARTAEHLQLGNVQVLTSRAEEGHGARYSVHRGHDQRVVTRAVAALPVLAELCLPLLQPGGLLVAQKARLTPEELEAGEGCLTAGR